VANPGWASTIKEQRSFSAVVIDVSHPRTSAHLDSLLRQPSIASASVQLLVIPPYEQDRLESLREEGSCLAWAWDPAAVDALENVLTLQRHRTALDHSGERCLWLCDDDIVGNLLAELHSLLVGMMRAAGKRLPARLLEAWSVYHRFRQLAVPLVRLEEERRQTYKTLTLGERVRALEEELPVSDGSLASYLDSRWPRVVQILRETYKMLLERSEPAKFYTLACALEEQLRQGKPGTDYQPTRIVAPTAHEGSMLAALLGELVDGWEDALQSGRVSITTVREEPRLIAEGQCQTSILLGFRTSESRYLDVYPGVPIHIIAYPYEAEVDEAIQRRVHTSIEQLQEDGPRMVVLQALRLPVGDQTSAKGGSNGQRQDGVPHSVRPCTSYRFDIQTKKPVSRRFLTDDAVEPLDISKLAGLSWSDEIVVERSLEGFATGRRESYTPVEFVEVMDTTGERLSYPATRLVDIYYPATEVKERIAAAALQPGMLIVVLVDDPYEDLFQRLLEAIREQRDIKASMALDLWQYAKRAALTKYGGSRRKLHAALTERGLSVEYAAVVGWYAEGEEEIIAPLKEADFETLARASGLYSDPTLIRATFACIHKERNNRRQYGKHLCRLLAQIAAGQHYEAALQSARALGTPLEQVAAAVSLREIESVRRLGTLSNL
jgi:hypothetical protein